MFNLSSSELVFLLLIGLVVLGPEKLPGALRQFGRIYSELRRVGQGFQTELRSALDEPMREIRDTADLARSAVMAPLGDDAPRVSDVTPRSISESVRRVLEGDDVPAAPEVATESPGDQTAPAEPDADGPDVTRSGEVSAP